MSKKSKTKNKAKTEQIPEVMEILQGQLSKSLSKAQSAPATTVTKPTLSLHAGLVTPFAALGLHPPKPGQGLTLTLPPSSADALACAAWATERRLSDPRCGPLLVVCAQALDANRIAEEIPFFSPALNVGLLPDWETLPYEVFSPHQDLVSQRLATLYAALNGNLDVLVVAASTAIQRLAPASFLAARTFVFSRGERLDQDKLRAQLQLAGYTPVTQVVSPGEYAVRGGLVDLFPTGATLPYRLDLFDDEIDQIRTFDPDSQRTLYNVAEVRILPGREFPFDEAARSQFRNRWRERFEGDPSRIALYKDVGQGIPSAGIEYYLPLFFETTATVFDYLGDASPVMLIGDCHAAASQFWHDTEERWRFLRHDGERPVLAPEDLFVRADDLMQAARVAGRVQIVHNAPEGLETRNSYARPCQDVTVDRRADDPVQKLRLQRQASRQQQQRTLLLAESPGRRETLAQYLNDLNIDTALVDSWQAFCQSNAPDDGLASAPLMLGVGPLAHGFALTASANFDAIEVLTESELFTLVGRQRRRKHQATTDLNAIVRDLSELKPGDPVVHVQHGIARYQGLETMDLGDGATEFLHLKYAGDASLYVPVAQLHVISRYSGASADDAPLHALGSGHWEKAKRKAAQQARDTAAELLNIYARRALRKGHAFKFLPHDYEAFAEGFGFEETPDQSAAIHAVVQDMVSDKPMDRLICGDVGFGKTEVALRAAFMAVMDGKQVAVLCPTTLLAEQHYQTFCDRFADWPVKLAEMSRFRSSKEIASALDGLNSGKIDIVIGTHKLLSKETRFDRLGLVIIDEEHRFGVRQKEALKALRAEVDVLTLTATPIPRTLAMSMEGLRDFSVIATAPNKRLAIKTMVRKESPSIIREALLREFKRGGQAYFLHNEVDTIETRRQMLAELLPEARIAVAHGQMPERELERVMRDFTQQRYNVLLCTTIIETGIDVPSANTMIMHRADKFGLAQLHQLRGRVGRSHHQAYAYLLIPDEQAITKDALKRLEAIQSMEELGSGFFLAMHDLEIRGAGEVLGDNQSGDMQEVGFQLYTDMLNQAVRALKAGKEPDIAAPLIVTTEINLHIPALLPEDFCGDVHERLTLYKRLANGSDADSLQALQEELIDRFGKLPEPARALMETHKLRVLCQSLGIIKIDAGEEALVIQFGQDNQFDPGHIIRIVQQHRSIRLAGPDRLRIACHTPDLNSRVLKIKDVIKLLRNT